MKQKEIVVRCIYSKGETRLPQLVEESFRLFVHRAFGENPPFTPSPLR